MNKRYDQLDSMRGLASLTVFFHHLLLAYPVLPVVFSYSPARILVGGHQAVILFFILSGFCLALPFLKGSAPAYPGYLIKRVFRIYIPYLVAILLAIAAAYQLHSRDLSQMGKFFHAFWQSGFDLSLITAHLTLLGNFNSYAYNTVVWSLIHEMRISLFFPLLMWFVIKRGLIFNLALCLALNIFSALNDIYQFETSRGYFTSFTDTVYFTTFFIIGALAAKHRGKLIEGYWKLPKFYKMALLLAALILYTYAKIGSMMIPVAFNRVFDDYSVAVSVVVFIIMALASSKVSGVLNQGPIKFLGKISYSLYLYHFVVMLTFAYAMPTTVPYWITAVSAFAVSILVAAVSYTVIEKPSMRLGKLVSSKWSGSKNKQAPDIRQAG